MSEFAPQSFLVALTGGIASGKTAAANEFAALGIPVIDADQIARDVVEPGTAGLAKIVAQFGAGVLNHDGRLDRHRMRELVFSDPTLRKKLEAITHPAIREELARRSAAAQGMYKIHVIPLLIEGGRTDAYDRVLVVDCPEETQIKRLMQRDNTDELAAQRILAAQATRDQRLAIADDVLENIDDLAALRARVRALHENYLKMATVR